ncbi:MAG: hypothetical protein GY765_26990 [bacterium]|nr:hypothetical protein [bacterium]
MKATLEEIQDLVRVQLGLRKVSPDSRFMEDLGAESADIVNILAACQDKFEISFEEVDVSGIRTIRQLFEFLIAMP